MSAGLTESLAEFVSGLEFEAIPGSAWPVVRAGFLDCVAAMAAGRNEPVVGMLTGLLGAGNHGEATLCLGAGRALLLIFPPPSFFPTAQAMDDSVKSKLTPH